jgi:hypothetical protein
MKYHNRFLFVVIVVISFYEGSIDFPVELLFEWMSHYQDSKGHFLLILYRWIWY